MSAINKRKKILVICPFPYGKAAGQRLKYEQYFDYWSQLGYDITVSNFMDENLWEVVYLKGFLFKKFIGVIKGHIRRIKDIFRISQYNIVYVFMWVTPFGTTILERIYLKFANKVIFDLEDMPSKQTISRKKLINPITAFIKNPKKQLYLIEHSHHVITSSPYLNQICMGINKYKACTYITASVDTKVFIPSQSKKKDKSPIIVGWTGTFSSKSYLEDIEDVLQELAKTTKYRLHIISNFDYELENVDVKSIKWTKEKEVEDLKQFDIGLYPLPFNKWIEGKSGLKAIQYLAFGIPTVASNSGNTPNVIDDNVNGILVTTKEEWIRSLKELINNAHLRIEMGENARKKAIQNYSIEVVSKLYANVLKSL